MRRLMAVFALHTTLLGLACSLPAQAAEPPRYPELIAFDPPGEQPASPNDGFVPPIQTSPAFSRPVGTPERKVITSEPKPIQAVPGNPSKAAPGPVTSPRFAEPIPAPPALTPPDGWSGTPSAALPCVPSQPLPNSTSNLWPGSSHSADLSQPEFPGEGSQLIPPAPGTLPDSILNETEIPAAPPVESASLPITTDTELSNLDLLFRHMQSDVAASDSMPAGSSCDSNLCPTPELCGKFAPFIQAGIAGGNHRVLGEGGLFIPLWQDCESLLYTSLTGRGDDHGAADGFFGVGYRQYFNPYLIWGVYGFYDLRASDQGHIYNQGNIGVELLTLNWDFRINGYFPGSPAKSAKNAASFSNGTIVTQNFRERAYPGLDFEIGERFLYWGWNDRFEVRWFLGGYYFDQSSSAFPAFGGPRGRLEMRVHDLGFLGRQSRLEIGAEASYDRVRNEQIYGYCRVRIPFGRGGKDSRPLLDALRRRMVDAPVRPVN